LKAINVYLQKKCKLSLLSVTLSNKHVVRSRLADVICCYVEYS